MENKDKLTLLFTGSDINASVLQEILEENNIPSMIKNNMNSGLAAGFSGGLQGIETQLLVKEDDKEKAKPILEEFLKSINNS